MFEGHALPLRPGPARLRFTGSHCGTACGFPIKPAGRRVSSVFMSSSGFVHAPSCGSEPSARFMPNPTRNSNGWAPACRSELPPAPPVGAAASNASATKLCGTNPKPAGVEPNVVVSVTEAGTAPTPPPEIVTALSANPLTPGPELTFSVSGFASPLKLASV